MRADSPFPRTPAWLKPWRFPLACAALYAGAFFLDPDKTLLAVSVSGTILLQLVLPMCAALSMMVLLNRFLSPSLASRLLGRGAGPRGVVLSALAGIVSMGPIYAWYPLFTTLKDKGASAFNIANFMCCRSVKPVLIPVLVGYFGWRFTGLFLLLTLVGALLSAACVGLSRPFGDGGE